MIRRYCSLFLAKQIKSLLRILQLSGGTALPGLLLEKIHSNILEDVANNFSRKIIVVSGTNGKTSTTNILSNIFANNQISVISNYAGSNLKRGVLSAYLDSLNYYGKFIGHNSVMVLEIDEGVLPEICEKLNPNTIILLNLFRDQLDRYGEIESIREKWIEILGKDQFKTSRIIINADDFLLADMGNVFQGDVSFFGVDDQLLDTDNKGRIIETNYCYCGNKIVHSLKYYAHIGKWHCSSCNNAQVKPDVVATNVHLSKNGIGFNLNTQDASQIFESSSIGLFSVYNTLAAFTALINLGLNLQQIKNGFNPNNQLFGRQESFQIDGRSIKLFLVKNPAGLNQVIDSLIQKNNFNEPKISENNLNILFALNNHIEDGRDVSWIYDADIESLVKRISNLVVSGNRLYDLALRFVIAGAKEIETQTGIKKSLSLIIEKSPPGSDIYLLLTYSAMMDYRKYVAKISGRKPFWQINSNE